MVLEDPQVPAFSTSFSPAGNLSFPCVCMCVCLCAHAHIHVNFFLRREYLLYLPTFFPSKARKLVSIWLSTYLNTSEYNLRPGHLMCDMCGFFLTQTMTPKCQEQVCPRGVSRTPTCSGQIHSNLVQNWKPQSIPESVPNTVPLLNMVTYKAIMFTFSHA